MVFKKNESNIMVKNVVDVIYGGFVYWLFGFGFSFGWDVGVIVFNGFGKFFIDVENDEMGDVFVKYFFYLFFFMIVMMIVLGVMVECVEFKVYILFLFVNMLIYCFFVYWIWELKGWFYKMDVIDVVGCGLVYVVGGFSGLVVMLYL